MHHLTVVHVAVKKIIEPARMVKKQIMAIDVDEHPFLSLLVCVCPPDDPVINGMDDIKAAGGNFVGRAVGLRYVFRRIRNDRQFVVLFPKDVSQVKHLPGELSYSINLCQDIDQLLAAIHE